MIEDGGQLDQSLLYLLNLGGQQAVSLVEVVASLAEDASTRTVEDIAAIDG